MFAAVEQVRLGRLGHLREGDEGQRRAVMRGSLLLGAAAQPLGLAELWGLRSARRRCVGRAPVWQLEAAFVVAKRRRGSGTACPVRRRLRRKGLGSCCCGGSCRRRVALHPRVPRRPRQRLRLHLASRRVGILLPRQRRRWRRVGRLRLLRWRRRLVLLLGRAGCSAGVLLLRLLLRLVQLACRQRPLVLGHQLLAAGVLFPADSHRGGARKEFGISSRPAWRFARRRILVQIVPVRTRLDCFDARCSGGANQHGRWSVISHLILFAEIQSASSSG